MMTRTKRGLAPFAHQAQHYLESFINHEIYLDQKNPASFKLERVRELLNNLGNPQKNLKVIHVAGSKGKGSICALTANVLRKAGFRVGLYTSPHINSYRERIRVLDETRFRANAPDIFPDMISEEELSEVVEEIKPVVEKMRSGENPGTLSFFEFITALAAYYFYKQKVDFVVFETGLGGRFDATNAVASLAAVIAPVSMEHTQILGAAIGQIAREKAAIIKDKKQKVIIAPQEKKVREVLKGRCRRFSIEPLWVEDTVQCGRVARDIEHQAFDLMTLKGRYKNLSLPLLGKHQRDNAAVVVGVVESLQGLGFRIPSKAIHEGFKNIFWPCRFEICQREPLVVLDSAHNKASINALVKLMKEIFASKKIRIVLGVSKDKDVGIIYDTLKNIAKEIIFVKANHPRAHDFPGSLSVKEAVDSACQKSVKTDIILVTGSVFVAAEARRHLLSIEKRFSV